MNKIELKEKLLNMKENEYYSLDIYKNTNGDNEIILVGTIISKVTWYDNLVFIVGGCLDDTLLISDNLNEEDIIDSEKIIEDLIEKITETYSRKGDDVRFELYNKRTVRIEFKQ